MLKLYGRLLVCSFAILVVFQPERDELTSFMLCVNSMRESHHACTQLTPNLRFFLRVALSFLFVQVRGAVQDFLARSPTPHLILFMSGHGEQQEKRCKNQPVQDMFLLPERGGKVLDYYTDKDLTDDIRSCLPAHKRLYIVCHACHSGGLVNLWELDARDKWVVLFASLEASILQEWNSSEVEPGFYQSFCKHSKRGQKLQDIAEGILNDTTRHHAGNIVRPAFITSRPVLALEKFLVTQ